MHTLKYASIFKRVYPDRFGCSVNTPKVRMHTLKYASIFKRVYPDRFWLFCKHSLLHILSPQPIVKRAMENNNPHAINYASKCILSLGEMDISKG